MTPTDLQVALDGVASHRELSCEEPHRRTRLVLERDAQEIRISEFGVSATPLIDGLGDWFNVLRVDTQPDPAQMVRLQTFGPRSYAFLPNGSVSYDSLLTDSYLPVAPLTNGSAVPDPAGSGIPSVLDRKVPLINQPCAFGHTSTSYMTLSLRAELEGYEPPP